MNRFALCCFASFAAIVSWLATPAAAIYIAPATSSIAGSVCCADDVCCCCVCDGGDVADDCSDEGCAICHIVCSLFCNDGWRLLCDAACSACCDDASCDTCCGDDDCTPCCTESSIESCCIGCCCGGCCGG